MANQFLHLITNNHLHDIEKNVDIPIELKNYHSFLNIVLNNLKWKFLILFHF